MDLLVADKISVILFRLFEKTEAIRMRGYLSQNRRRNTAQLHCRFYCFTGCCYIAKMLSKARWEECFFKFYCRHCRTYRVSNLPNLSGRYLLGPVLANERRYRQLVIWVTPDFYHHQILHREQTIKKAEAATARRSSKTIETNNNNNKHGLWDESEQSISIDEAIWCLDASLRIALVICCNFSNFFIYFIFIFLSIKYHFTTMDK